MVQVFPVHQLDNLGDANYLSQPQFLHLSNGGDMSLPLGAAEMTKCNNDWELGYPKCIGVDLQLILMLLLI